MKKYRNVRRGWRVVGLHRIYFRSKWEANYAFYLDWLSLQKKIMGWLHEPKVFWFEGIKRGCVSYLPDFQVLNYDGTHYWVEVKGWMDAKSKTKIKRFRKYYPDEKLIVVDAAWFRANACKLKLIVPNWE
jgi:hypothetical protein